MLSEIPNGKKTNNLDSKLITYSNKKLKNKMIQRIQTVYLSAIVILMAITIFNPIVSFVNEKDSLFYMLDFKGISQIKNNVSVIESTTWGLTSVSVVISILTLITIFSFKNRLKQIRLSVINLFLTLIYYLLLIFYIWTACTRLNTDWHLHLVSLFPLLCSILIYLAIGAIGKDEKLVKSLNRLR